MVPRLATPVLRVSLILCAVALLTGGCSSDPDADDPAPPECSRPEECKANETCEDGRCVSLDPDAGTPDGGALFDAAAGDAESDTGQSEDVGLQPDEGPADTGRPPVDQGPGCEGPEDCLEDEFCNPETGACQLACRPCDNDNPCVEGERCDWRRGDYGCCLDECVDDSTCPAEEYCDPGARQCAPGCRIGQCGDNNFCHRVERTCQPGCLTHANCPAGTLCDEDLQTCVPGCLNDDGCEDGQRCDPGDHQCTWGCVEDDDCAAGQGCHLGEHLCRRRCGADGDCPEGLTCNERATICVRDGDHCLHADADPCPDDTTCNPFLGGCVPEPGDACTGPSDCPAESTCLPLAPAPGEHDPPLACLPSAGEGAPATACAAHADCASGRCLNDGTCFAPCADAAACPEGQRCWPVPFYQGPGFDPRDASDDGFIDVSTCRVPPTPCGLDAECGAPGEVCRPWLDPDAGALTTVCLPAGPGVGAPGSPCRGDGDCSTGWCTPQGLCLATCTDDAACGEGRVCGEQEIVQEGARGQVRTCMPDPGTGDPCTHDGECAADGEHCRPEAEGGELHLRCRPGVGAAASEPCAHHLECASGFCLPRGLCFGACTSDDHCTGDESCEQDALGLPSLPEGGSSQTCLTPEVPCMRNSDCPRQGTACIPGPSLQNPGTVALRCAPQVGPGEAGWACRQDAECQTGVCMLQEGEEVGSCWASCGDDADCPDGGRCDLTGYEADVDGALLEVPICGPGVGSLQPCVADGDCPDAEVCTARVDEAGDGLETVCITPLADAVPMGCQVGEECPSGVCLPNEMWAYCLVVCGADEDCGLAGVLVCQEGPVEIDGVEGQINQCGVAAAPAP